MYRSLLVILFLCSASLHSQVTPGIDRLFSPPYVKWIEGKRLGLCTNHTALNREMRSSIDIVKEKARRHKASLQALFAPEHGIDGTYHAAEKVAHEKSDKLPIYSLHGKTRRPTKEMLEGLDVILFDIQDIGSRSYTYISTLFYLMEEAAKKRITVIVLDRPNPINGVVVDGPMLDSEWRSFVGYVNVPYCHGMTIGELANYFNQEYKVRCSLKVVPMSGWKRSMTFKDTGLAWVPTSPNIPEADTPLYYPMTGILGELGIVNIGVGYTLPFKVVGAPWIDKELFAKHLNRQNFPGVRFHPFSYQPFFGKYAKKTCHGVMIHVTDPLKVQPVAIQYLLVGILKSLYHKQFTQGLSTAVKRKAMFCKVNGTEEVYRIMRDERYIVWKLRGIHQDRRKNFEKTRMKYLLKEYAI